jgi:HK97 family phage major capsid protein
VVDEERALGLGSTGVPLPFTLDPSIITSGTDVLNPVRSVASVKTIITNTWHIVSSDRVTAAFATEATEASDNTPTLVQPIPATAMAQAFHDATIRRREPHG